MLAELQRAFARELARESPALSAHWQTTLGARAAALAGTYPVCRRLVGDEFFEALARRAARALAAPSPDLNDYGADLAEFLASFPAARELPYLPDVARLEWALQRARHAAEPPPVLPERWRGATRFPAAPGTTFLASPYPIHAIWHASQEGAGDEIVSLDGNPVALVVAREPDGARFSAIPEPELVLFTALASGKSLAEASAGWRGSAESLAAALARAVGRGWLG